MVESNHLSGGIYCKSFYLKDMKTPLKFSVNQLILKEESCTFSDFDTVKEEDLESEKIGTLKGDKEEILAIRKIRKLVFDDRFVCLSIEEGNKYPYPDKVVNASKLEEVDNPRAPDEIELNDQLFVLIDTKTSRIFFSNQRKKAIFCEWLSEKLGLRKSDIVAKPLIVEKDFLNKIKTINEISFAVEPNLFSNAEGTLSGELMKDIFGFGAEEAIVKLVYRNRILSPSIKEKLTGVLNRKEEFKNITIIGRTADEFESIFNENEVINKLPIHIEPDEKTQKLDEEKVFTLLISKIKEDSK